MWSKLHLKTCLSMCLLTFHHELIELAVERHLIEKSPGRGSVLYCLTSISRRWSHSVHATRVPTHVDLGHLTSIYFLESNVHFVSPDWKVTICVCRTLKSFCLFCSLVHLEVYRPLKQVATSLIALLSQSDKVLRRPNWTKTDVFCMSVGLVWMSPVS